MKRKKEGISMNENIGNAAEPKNNVEEYFGYDIPQERTSFGTMAKKLPVPRKYIRPGFVYRWVNDVGQNVQERINRGWRFVLSEEGLTVGDRPGVGTGRGNTDLGSRVSTVVGTDKSGAAIRAYFMRIDKDWHAEECKAFEEVNSRIDKAINTLGSDAIKQGVPRDRLYGKVEYTP